MIIQLKVAQFVNAVCPQILEGKWRCADWLNEQLYGRVPQIYSMSMFPKNLVTNMTSLVRKQSQKIHEKL